MKFKYFIGILLAAICACESKNSDIPTVVERVEKLGYLDLINTSMYLRERGSEEFSGVIYLNDSKGPCSPYLVDYHFKDSIILSVNDKLVYNSCGKQVFARTEIEEYIQQYAKFDVRGIEVDLDTNIFIRTNILEKEDLIKTKDSSLIEDMVAVPGYPYWYTVD